MDLEFEQIRGEILKKDPPLNLEETYYIIRCDFTQPVKSKLNHPESSAMVAWRTKPQQPNVKID